MTVDELRAMMVCSVAQSAEVLDISRNTAYDAIRTGTFPVEVIRIGRRLLVPTAPLLRLLEGAPINNDGPDSAQAIATADITCAPTLERRRHAPT